jgi:tRNA isopentenyl-2-thiomethyl-A-37 hydroxylase MiaE
MLKGAIINEIQAKVPEQFKPKGADGDRFSQAFVSAMNGVGTDPAAQAAQERLRWEYLAAHTDGYELMANKTGTGLAMFANLGEQERAEKKKREDEERDYATRNAVNAMKQRLQDIADEWGKIADEYERKLGGINKIGEQLGVKRKSDQSEEEYRRLVNEMILRKVASGEIDPNSDMAAMAQARDNQYEALQAGQEAEALINEGKVEEAERLVERLEDRALIQRNTNELNSGQANEVIDAETIKRDNIGTAQNLSTNEMDQRDEASIDFWGTENDEFAASAEALAVTESFNLAAEGQASAPTPEVELNQQVQLASLKPAGMMGA